MGRKLESSLSSSKPPYANGRGRVQSAASLRGDTASATGDARYEARDRPRIPDVPGRLATGSEKLRIPMKGRKT